MTDLPGFIVSDKTRRALFVELAAGETAFDRIVKKHRLLKPAATRALADLEDRGLVEAADGAVSLTALGEDASRELKRQDVLR
jgi:predicted transcriptional regulator